MLKQGSKNKFNHPGKVDFPSGGTFSFSLSQWARDQARCLPILKSSKE